MKKDDTKIKNNFYKNNKKKIIFILLLIIVVYAGIMLFKLITNPVDTFLVENRQTLF